jgi:enoyl-CoA hydratase/carnithine racemase
VRSSEEISTLSSDARNGEISTLRSDVHDGVLTLTLDRPAQRNALNDQLRAELAQQLDEAARAPGVRAVILTGANGAFCAGGDLGSFEDLHDARAYRHVSHVLTSLMDAIERLEKPVIAAIDGVATGAGLTLALSCDWRIGSQSTRLLFREGRLGLVPTHGGVGRLVKLIGLARAQEAILGGEDLDAHDAMRLGLITELAPEGELLQAADARARKMLRRAPLSFGATKRLLHLAADTDLRNTVLAESLAQSALLLSDDHREGLAAARERRDPEFTGS